MGTRTRLRRRIRPALLGLAVLATACGSAGRRTPLMLATTTTVEDSGLLEALVAAFTAEHPEIHLRVVTVGTGQALEMGRRGDVDVLLTHDPAAESAFVAEGYGIERRPVMYNDFVIAGPAADPAGVGGMQDAVAALRRIARTRSSFVSRGDDSGTHRKERWLWRAAGLEPEPSGGDDDWYIEAGVGMADALRVASARDAYLLTDRATLLTTLDRLELTVLVEGDDRLLNRYGVTRVADSPHAEAARVFADWLTAGGGREVIRRFGRERFRRALFHPSTAAPSGAPATPVN